MRVSGSVTYIVWLVVSLGLLYYYLIEKVVLTTLGVLKNLICLELAIIKVKEIKL